MKIFLLFGLCASLSPDVYAQTSGWDAAMIRFQQNAREPGNPPVNLRFFGKTAEKPAPRQLGRA